MLDDDLDPAHLVFLIIALAAWWQAVPQLARMLTGADGADPAERARLAAACVVRAAQRLARRPARSIRYRGQAPAGEQEGASVRAVAR